MSLYASEMILRAVRHDMASYELPLSSEELSAIRSDKAIANILSKNVTEVDQFIAELFADYHAGLLPVAKFSEQYGFWIRLRKTICR